MTSEIDMLRAVAGYLSTQNPPVDRAQANSLKKALVAANGFVGINLEEEAKMYLPLFAGLRHRLPAVPAARGANQAQWRMLLGFGAFAFGAAASFGVADDANGPATAEAATTILADYTEQSINGGVGWTAIQKALGWDNAMTIDTMMALSLLLRLEELIVLMGNRALLAPPVIAGNPSTATAINTFAAGNWHIRVTAITGQATLTGGAGTAGAVLNNVGESAISNTLQIVVPGGDCDFLDVSWPAVPGAVGYKVYCETAAASGVYALLDPTTQMAYANLVAGSFFSTIGNPILVPANQRYVTVNHVQILAPGTVGQPADPGAVDRSANANVFEGMVSWAEKQTIYTQLLPNARIMTDMAGMPLTVSATGIPEFDAILQTQWRNNHISPSLIICSPQAVTSVSNRIAAAGGSTQIRLDVYKDRNAIVGGLYVGYYVNKFAASMAGQRADIPIWAHPYMPDGTFLFLAEDVPPETYPYARQAKLFELDVMTPYTYLELGRATRSFPYDVFVGETLKCYYPDATSSIVGARVDS
jgi:hypothetical protein